MYVFICIYIYIYIYIYIAGRAALWRAGRSARFFFTR